MESVQGSSHKSLSFLGETALQRPLTERRPRHLYYPMTGNEGRTSYSFVVTRDKFCKVIAVSETDIIDPAYASEFLTYD